MKIEIKILSPVYIGSGEVITPSEYISIDKNRNITDKLSEKLCRINMDKLFQNPSVEPFIETFIQYASTSSRYIGNFLDNPSLQKVFNEVLLKNILYEVEVSPSAKNKNLINLNLFIKSGGRVYIPGSSLKGSLLSGIIYHILKEKKFKNFNNQTKFNEILDIVIGEIGRSDKREKDRFIRYLDVSDSELKSPEEVLEISYVEVIGGKRKGIPLLCETLKPGATFISEMKTSLNSFYKFGKYSPVDILKMADGFYRKVCEKFKYKLPPLSDGEYLVRIGQGSSVLSTSLLLLAEELKILGYSVSRRGLPSIKPGELPRTQKLIKNIPMGWISIRPIES